MAVPLFFVSFLLVNSFFVKYLGLTNNLVIKARFVVSVN